MAHPALDRKTFFRVALAVQRETVEEVATREGVTRTHLYLVLGGERESPRLNRALDGYIQKGCQQLVRQALRTFPALQAECRAYHAAKQVA